MTRILGAAILLSAVFAIIWMAGVRPERNPLLIDAKSEWCTFQPQGPLVTTPRQYDYQVGKRRIGDRA